MKRWQKILLMVLAVGAAVILWRVSAGGPDSDTYAFTEVVRTDLRATVSSTGELSAVETVEVGTQVSGQIEEVYVDFNDHVERGELLALIDTETLDAELENAQARLQQAEAQRAEVKAQIAEAEANLADARATLERNQPLAERGYLSQSEFQTIETSAQAAEATVERVRASLRSSEAQVAQARAQVAQARKNRQNAEIRAPISGVVIERSVEAGQTVAASFETPTLFVLAEDLEQMRILADVDESDIGQAQSGQKVTFTVPAYPDETYEGTVRQVRLQPTTTQNVVTYTVVVEAPNTDGRLLPGMTATVNFVTGEAEDVLAVSTAALQLQPTDEMQAAVSEEETPRPAPEEVRPTALPDSASERGSFAPGATSRLWYLDDEGELRTVPVRTGLSTGALTQIAPVDSSDGTIQPGLRVIEQVLTGTDTSPQNGGGNGPGGGPGRGPRM